MGDAQIVAVGGWSVGRRSRGRLGEPTYLVEELDAGFFGWWHQPSRAITLCFESVTRCAGWLGCCECGGRRESAAGTDAHARGRDVWVNVAMTDRAANPPSLMLTLPRRVSEILALARRQHCGRIEFPDFSRCQCVSKGHLVSAGVCYAPTILNAERHTPGSQGPGVVVFGPKTRDRKVTLRRGEVGWFVLRVAAVLVVARPRKDRGRGRMPS